MSLGWLALFGLAALRPLRIDELKVTEGAVVPSPSQGLSIMAPKVRAVAVSPGLTEMQTAELRFRYLGPTDTIAKLDDGESRQQLGLKLRALDACNVVYVMWRIQPKSELAVQVKTNPGLSTSRECGARGYRKLKVRVALPVLQPGDQHALRAELRQGTIEVFVDGTSVWRGSLGVDGAPLMGPIGLRTDNVRMDFTLAGDGP